MRPAWLGGVRGFGGSALVLLLVSLGVRFFLLRKFNSEGGFQFLPVCLFFCFCCCLLFVVIFCGRGFAPAVFAWAVFGEGRKRREERGVMHVFLGAVYIMSGSEGAFWQFAFELESLGGFLVFRKRWFAVVLGGSVYF